jgi:hypothetical protein
VGSLRGSASREPSVLREGFALLAGSSALIVGVLYAIGRLLAERFYRSFGLSPSDAGLSTTDLVGQAAGAAIWFGILAAPGLTLIALLNAERDTLRRRIKFWQFLILALVVLVAACVAPGIALNRANATSVDLTVPVIAFGTVIAAWVWTVVGDIRALRLVAVLIVVGAVAFAVWLAVMDVEFQASQVKEGRINPRAPWSLYPVASNVLVKAYPNHQVPIEVCIVELGHAGNVWLLWDSVNVLDRRGNRVGGARVRPVLGGRIDRA